MSMHWERATRALAISVALSAGILLPAGGASAYTFKTLFSFCNTIDCKVRTGASPLGGVIEDSSGNLYGTLLNNGVYELSPTGNEKHPWRYKSLHDFVDVGDPKGNGPMGSLVMDTAGDLYGVTSSGGTGSAGTIYELIPNAQRTRWKFKLLHTFCTAGGDCVDGSSPRNGLTYAGAATGALYDGVSPLYGTTVGGGSSQNCGVVFRLAFNGRKWHETVAHVFNSGPLTPDGCNPNAVTADSDDNLYGTTQATAAADYDNGTVFKLIPNRRRTMWTETLPKIFDCTDDNPPHCPDGVAPVGGVTLLGGNIFGTTIAGGTGEGASCINSGQCGVAFEITPDGTYSKIYNFCSLQDCTDGAAPRTTMVADESGNLLGVTVDGGANLVNSNAGTVFELDAEHNEQVVHSFCTVGSCADGRMPNIELYRDANGNIFGTTSEGGLSGNPGTVFELTP